MQQWKIDNMELQTWRGVSPKGGNVRKDVRRIPPAFGTQNRSETRSKMRSREQMEEY